MRISHIVGVIGLAGALALQPASAQTTKKSPRKASAQKSSAQQNPSRAFAWNVVQSAVALRQSDPQDRLRVLASAVSIGATLNPKTAKQWAREGAEIEASLIAAGQQPAVSMLATGQADCAAALAFVEKVSPSNLAKAEQSLIGALSNCRAQTKEAIRARVDAAMAERVIAPRLTMAMIDSEGAKTPWAQQKFKEMFSSLPDPQSEIARREAVNFAAMYGSVAKNAEKDAAKRAGVSFLTWLGKLPTSGERNMATNITVGAMKDALGEEGYSRALEADVTARQAAETSGAAGELPQQDIESASVLEAMASTEDQTEALNQLPVSLRARKAAANGFARGTSGDKRAAENYFDIAFSAANENWNERGSSNRAAEVVEEVSQAAAHVDAVSALNRAQKQLTDPTAQAIGMIAVARVVMGRQGR